MFMRFLPFKFFPNNNSSLACECVHMSMKLMTAECYSLLNIQQKKRFLNAFMHNAPFYVYQLDFIFFFLANGNIIRSNAQMWSSLILCCWVSFYNFIVHQTEKLQTQTLDIRYTLYMFDAQCSTMQSKHSEISGSIVQSRGQNERQYHQNDIAPRIELFNRCDAVTAAGQPTSQPTSVAQAH